MEGVTIIAGIEIPSTSPLFLGVVGFHVALGLACVVTGAVAMLSPKRAGRHPTFGTIYFWCLSAVFVSATALSAMRWAEDYHLFILGVLSFAAAIVGRSARRRRRPGWRARQRNGAVLYPVADRLLRGQRKELAALEGASDDRLLAGAWRDRNTDHRLGAPAASGRTGFQVGQGICCRQKPSLRREAVGLARGCVSTAH